MYHTTPIAIATGDIFRVIDTAIHKLRQFASNFNVHITLVIHPRKDDESQLLTLSSVSLSFFLSLSLSLCMCFVCMGVGMRAHFRGCGSLASPVPTFVHASSPSHTLSRSCPCTPKHTRTTQPRRCLARPKQHRRATTSSFCRTMASSNTWTSGRIASMASSGVCLRALCTLLRVKTLAQRAHPCAALCALDDAE